MLFSCENNVCLLLYVFMSIQKETFLLTLHHLLNKNMFLLLILFFGTVISFQYSSILYILYLINCKRNALPDEIVAITNVIMIMNMIELSYTSYILRTFVWFVITNPTYYYWINDKLTNIFKTKQIVIESCVTDIDCRIKTEYNNLTSFLQKLKIS